MEEEQEGIKLETINPDDDVIELSSVEEEEELPEVMEDETESDTEINNEGNEKEKSLQRGVNKERQRRKEAL